MEEVFGLGEKPPLELLQRVDEEGGLQEGRGLREFRHLRYAAHSQGADRPVRQPAECRDRLYVVGTSKAVVTRRPRGPHVATPTAPR